MKPTFDDRSVMVFTMITFAWFLVDQLSYPVPGHLSLTSPHLASPDLPTRLWVLKCPGNLRVQSCLNTLKVPGNAGWLKQDQLRMEGLCSVPRD